MDIGLRIVFVRYIKGPSFYHECLKYHKEGHDPLKKLKHKLILLLLLPLLNVAYAHNDVHPTPM